MNILDAQKRLFYSIGDVSRATGVRPHVLRYWEAEFREISPKKSSNGKRLYREKDIAAVQIVKELLYEKKFTVVGARKALKQGREGSKDPNQILRLIRSDLKGLQEVLGVTSNQA